MRGTMTMMNDTGISNQRTRSDNPMEKSIFILFVDDDEIFLKVLSKYFQIQHPAYQIKTCKTGEECLTLLQSHQPDLLVIDYHLHGKASALQGSELLRAIKASGSEARLAVLSGREKAQMLPVLMKENVEDYIIKDMNALAELEKVLKKHFA
jgi:two-component system nitrate/nitrite response regulator NarL